MVLPLLILFLNGYIILHSLRKLEQYDKIPPFNMIDYTRSGKVAPDSPLASLLDNDLATSWEKKSSGDEFDFELELSLSHVYKDGKYQPKKFGNLYIQKCPGDRLEKFTVSIFLREAINIDKELRMPNDTALAVTTAKFHDGVARFTVPYTPKETDQFSKNMYIVGLKGRGEGNYCLSGVKLD